MKTFVGTVVLAMALGLWVRPVSAKVDFETDIQTDTTWTLDHGPYYAAVDVTVAQGARLTIEPGVQILLGEGRNLVVHGELVARGTPDEPILFSWMGPQQQERWGSLVFEDTAVDAVFQDVDEYQSGSIVEHCIFEHGTKAVRLNASSPYINRSTFRHNLYSSMDVADIYGGAALFVGMDSHPRVRGCTFEGNTAEGAAQGGAVCVDRAHPIFQDNVFEGNLSIYGGAVTTNNMASPLVGNVFQDNEGTWEGGGISFVSSISAFYNNTVTGNHAINDGGGVHVCVTCFPHANPVVMDNVITDNRNQVEGAAGFGAAYIRVFAYNVLHSNRMGDAPADFGWFNELHDHYPAWVVNPDISRNWWGTTDVAAIDETIHDGDDDPAMGVVTYEPVLQAAPEGPRTRVAITSLKLRYDQDGEPMPVYLTLYNPGDGREVDLLVRLEYPGSPALFMAEDPGFPGATREGDAWRLSLPDNAVWFTTLMEPQWPGDASPAGGRWVATLHDASTGEIIGEASSARFEMGEGGAE